MGWSKYQIYILGLRVSSMPNIKLAVLKCTPITPLQLLCPLIVGINYHAFAQSLASNIVDQGQGGMHNKN